MSKKHTKPLIIIIMIAALIGIATGVVVADADNPSQLPTQQVSEISNDGQIEAWERAAYPLRIDDTDAAVQLPPPAVFDGEELADDADGFTKGNDGGNSRSLLVDIDGDRNNAGIHNDGKTISITYDSGRANADSNFDDQSNIEFVSARITPQEGKGIPSDTSNALDLLSDIDKANANATFSILKNHDSQNNTLSNGEEQFEHTFDKPGQYVIFAAVTEKSKNGFETSESEPGANVDEGNVTVDGDVVIIGADELTVQQESSSVTPDSNPVPGDTVDFDIDAGDLSPDSNVTHTVALYNRSKFEDDAAFELVVNTSAFGNDFSSQEDTQLEHNIEEVNGVAEVEDGTTLNGNDLSDGTVSGTQSPSGIVDFLAEEAGTNTPNTDVGNGYTNISQMDASVTAVNGKSSSSTVSVETFSNFSEGTYRYIAISTLDKSESQSRSTTGTLSLTTPEGTANFAVNIDSINSSVTAGEDVVADYTIENTGDVTGTQDIEFLINGTTQDTNGSVTLDAGESTSGSFTYETGNSDTPAINVSVSSANETTSSDVTVDAPANFTVNLDSINSSVTAGEDVVADYTIENIGDVAGTQDIEFLINETTQRTNEDVTLAAGETTSGSFRYETGNSDTPAINVSVSSADDIASFDVSVVEAVSDITIQTAEVDFGEVTVGDTATAGVVVANDGTITKTVTATTDTDVFAVSVDQTEIAPGEQAFLTVETTPTDTGGVSGTLTVETADDADTDTADLTVDGQAPEVDITSADPLPFGATPLSSTTTKAVEITNDGTAPLTVTADNTITNSNFSIIGDTQLEVPTGESRNLSVGFSPQTVGEITADLSLTTNDPDTEQTTVTLTGEGTKTDVTLSSSTVSFGAVAVGNSATETITLTNDGSSFAIDEVTVGGTDFEESSDLSGTTLSADEDVDIDLVFDPATSGSQSGTVTISGSTETDGSTELSAALSGSGQIADLEVSSQTLRTGVTTADGTTTGSIAVENTGPAGTQLTVDALTLSDTEQFRLSSDGISEGTTIASGSDEQVGVTFDPASSENGVEETTLTLEASSGEQTFTREISVTGTISAPEPTISTDEISVGNIPLDDSESRRVTVSNDGGEPFNIESVDADSEDVTAQQVGSPEVVPGAERTVEITVDPSGTDDIDTTVDITTDEGDDLSVDVTGNVVAPEFSVGKQSVDFSDTQTGSAGRQTVTIDNDGSAPLTVAAPAISGSDSTAFSFLSGDQQLRIGSGQSETITVGFAPNAAGEKTATLSINPVNDPNRDAPEEIALTGTATEGNVGLSDSTISFGTLQPDSTQSQSLTLTNDGGAPVDITDSTVSGANSDAVSVTGLDEGRTLQGDDTETFDVEVDTEDLSRGSLTAQINIETTDTTVTSFVGGTVVSPELTVVGSADADAFGTTRLGEVSTTDIRVKNTGNADLEVTDLSIAGADADAFNIVDQPAETISPQSSKRIEMEFNPEALPDAVDRAQAPSLDASADLEIEHNAGSTRSVSLAGEAETTALTTPSTFRFGETPLGETSTQELTIENADSATTDLTITGVSLSGNGADEYGATLTESKPTLAPGEKTTVDLTLTPESPGRKLATLSVETTDPRQSVGKVGISNSKTVFSIEFGSVKVDYISPAEGQEPTVDVDRGLRGLNATLTSTTSDVNTTTDYALDYEFGATADEVGKEKSLESDTPVRYINATTTAQADRFNDSTFQVEVSKAAIASQNATPENVTIYHEDGDGYEPLETTRLYETIQGHVYEVTTDSYSIFAVGITEPTDTKEPDEPEEPEDNNEPSGTSGTVSSLEGDEDEEQMSDTPTIQSVRDQLVLLTPQTDTITEIEDATPDTPGQTIEPDGTQSVRQITFNDESVTGSVSIREYGNLPQETTDEVVSSIATDSGVESSDISVASVSDIEPTFDTTGSDSSASVRFAVPTDQVESPKEVTIYKEAFNMDSQTSQWEQQETEVITTSDEEVVVEAQVDSFSLFAVTEIDLADDQQPQQDEQIDDDEEPDEPADDGSGSGLIIGLLLIVAVVGAAVYLYTQQD